MRAAVLDHDRLSVREWPDPEPGPGEVLVALTRVGICGSDVHFALERSVRTAFLPIILGHEPAGMVAAVGSGVAEHWVGRRVAVVPMLSCGDCAFCNSGRTRLCRGREVLGGDRHGCWAEFVVVPEVNLLPVPDSLSDEVAAVATDAVATAFHAVRTRGGVGPGLRVAIWGAGGLGLCAVAIARSLGADSVVVVDPRKAARERALASGADVAYDPATAWRGPVDVALEFVGRTASVEAAIRSLDRGGRAVVVGIGPAQLCGGGLTGFAMSEREVVGSVGAEPHEVREVLDLLAEGTLVLANLVGEHVPLEDVGVGLQLVADGGAGGGRVVVDVT
jgi:D-arabinose 1-dehydrogenase-like Zn-dependent alcohol dehydrogenase